MDHMTDAVIEAYGPTLNEAFENAALALNDTMVDVTTVKPIATLELSVQAESLTELLFEWLDKVMLVLLVDRFVMCLFKVEIVEKDGRYSLHGKVSGEPLDLARHPYKVEIKAVTYHEMSIDRKKGETTVRFLLDL